MVRRTKAEAEITRQQILDAAEQVFAEKVVLQTTMTDIGTAAGVSRGAVYWHFQSKLDVFNAMLMRQRDIDRMLCAPARDSNEPDPLGQMRNFLIFFLQQMVSDPQRRRVKEILMLRCELAGEMAALSQQLQTTGCEIDRDIAATLTLAVQRGQLPTDLDVPCAAMCCHGYIHGLIANWLLRPDSYDLAAQASTLVDAMMDMLRNSPALRTSQT